MEHRITSPAHIFPQCKRAGAAAVVAGLIALAACGENSAPGNDRAASSAAPPTPAELVPPGKAIHEADLKSVFPETMIRAEIEKVVSRQGCSFTLTSASRPVLVVDAARDGSSKAKGVMKLNGKLVELQRTVADGDSASGTVVIRADGIEATVTPEAGEEADDNGARAAALRLILEESREIGFWGYYQCSPESAGSTAASAAGSEGQAAR